MKKIQQGQRKNPNKSSPSVILLFKEVWFSINNFKDFLKRNSTCSYKFQEEKLETPSEEVNCLLLLEKVPIYLTIMQL